MKSSGRPTLGGSGLSAFGSSISHTERPIVVGSGPAAFGLKKGLSDLGEAISDFVDHACDLSVVDPKIFAF